jgi:7,8-dihydroneopterin aldolase/epimerase/oxygenase
LGAGGFDEGPEFRVFLEGGVFADRQVRAIKKIFEGIAAEDAVHDHAKVVFLEIDPVIAEAEAVEHFAVAFQLAESFQLCGHDLMRQAAKFPQDIQLQFLGHAREFRRAGRVKDNLERPHQAKSLTLAALGKSKNWRALTLPAYGVPVDTIVISDLEVRFRVGVTDEERRIPQRLLLTVEMGSDFHKAIATDSIGNTVDYFAVSQALLKFGEGKEWRLIEKLAADIAEMVLAKFKPKRITVEVKKFAIPEAQFVAVRLARDGV